MNSINKNGFFVCLCLLIFSEAAFAKRAVITFKKNYKMNFLNMKSEFSKNQLSEWFNEKYRLNIQSDQMSSVLENLNSVIIKNVNDSEIKSLSENPNILAIEEEVIHPLPFPVNAFMNKPLKLSILSTAVNSMTPWGILSVKAAEAWNDSSGGFGTRILVLDTGIDRYHPSLRANLEQGKNFVDDTPTDYPYMDTIGHGSHVAGTIAGILTSTGFSGVAPKAHILAGRICNEEGCSSLAIIEGLNWAIEQKVDAVNMSLGSSWATSTEKEAIIKVFKAGITIVAASGNNGTNQIIYPAAMPQTIAVGAVDIQNKRADFSQYGPELSVVAPGVEVISSVPLGTGRESSVSFASGLDQFQNVKSIAFQGSKTLVGVENKKIVYAGLGLPEDFINADVEGNYVLIQRGEIKFSEKVDNAIQAKAAGVILYNNAPGLVNGKVTEDDTEKSVAVFMIEQSVGNAIKEALEKGEIIRAKLETLVTNFSSYNGTSMATPHVTGVVALMKAVNKNLTPTEIKDIIMKTATPSELNVMNQYGAGLVNAELAVKEALKSIP